ncbi:hypothetical protein LCGC14_1511600 [marine sediment metagenome]|uniref:Uncharacterized protein n=1 Tax=marine sediment metagenome TaxID=412755 RepID=A0A0F9J1H7_9ZZZZ
MQVGMVIKKMFFDPAKVKSRVDRTWRRVLSRFGLLTVTAIAVSGSAAAAESKPDRFRENLPRPERHVLHAAQGIQVVWPRLVRWEPELGGWRLEPEPAGWRPGPETNASCVRAWNPGRERRNVICRKQVRQLPGPPRRDYHDRKNCPACSDVRRDQPCGRGPLPVRISHDRPGAAPWMVPSPCKHETDWLAGLVVKLKRESHGLVRTDLCCERASQAAHDIFLVRRLVVWALRHRRRIRSRASAQEQYEANRCNGSALFFHESPLRNWTLISRRSSRL